MIKVNGQEIEGKEFAYDGCHKIYVIEDDEDRKNALEIEYDLYPIEQLSEKYNNSCELRFISNWKLTKRFVDQFEKAEFEYVETEANNG